MHFDTWWIKSHFRRSFKASDTAELISHGSSWTHQKLCLKKINLPKLVGFESISAVTKVERGINSHWTRVTFASCISRSSIKFSRNAMKVFVELPEGCSVSKTPVSLGSDWRTRKCSRTGKRTIILSISFSVPFFVVFFLHFIHFMFEKAFSEWWIICVWRFPWTTM